MSRVSHAGQNLHFHSFAEVLRGPGLYLWVILRLLGRNKLLISVPAYRTVNFEGITEMDFSWVWHQGVKEYDEEEVTRSGKKGFIYAARRDGFRRGR